jgi:hypothetical protein
MMGRRRNSSARPRRYSRRKEANVVPQRGHHRAYPDRGPAAGVVDAPARPGRQRENADERGLADLGTLYVYISSLRRKIGRGKIVTQRCRGYALKGGEGGAEV